MASSSFAATVNSARYVEYDATKNAFILAKMTALAQGPYAQSILLRAPLEAGCTPEFWVLYQKIHCKHPWIFLEDIIQALKKRQYTDDEDCLNAVHQLYKNIIELYGTHAPQSYEAERLFQTVQEFMENDFHEKFIDPLIPDQPNIKRRRPAQTPIDLARKLLEQTDFASLTQPQVLQLDEFIAKIDTQLDLRLRALNARQQVDNLKKREELLRQKAEVDKQLAELNNS